MKARDIIKIIEADGWYLARTKGSHRQYHHPQKKGCVTLAFHSNNADIAPGTINSVLKQAGLKEVRYASLSGHH